MKKIKYMIFTVSMCIIMAFPSTIPVLPTRNLVAQAAAVTVSTGISVPGKVTASSLIVRSKPAKNGARLQIRGKNVSLPKNTKVTILKEVINNKGKWYYVSGKWNGTTVKGYVSSDYVKLTLASKVPALVNKNTKVKIRTGASNKKAYLKVGGKAVALKTTTMNITGETTTSGEKWFKVSFKFEGKTRTGYIKGMDTKFKGKKTTTKTQAPKSSYVTTATGYSIPGVVTATSLNVRTKAGRTAPILKSGSKNVAIKNKVRVTILKEAIVKNEKWYYVSFKSGNKTLKGYVLSDYIKIATTKINGQVNSKKNVSIKTGASDKKPNLKVSGKAVSLKPKANITIISEHKPAGVKWFKVTFKHSGKTQTGYIKILDTIFKKTEKAKAPEKETPKEEEKKPSENDKGKSGQVNGTTVRVRAGAGTSHPQIRDKSNQLIYLNTGQEVTIKSESRVGSTVWYEISFDYQGTTYTGHISGDYVVINNEEVTEKPDDNKKPDLVLDDKEFEKALEKQGFPESYKSSLRTLHKQHPLWQFEAFHTGLDWDVVIKNQNKLGKNLITNSKNIAWKSLDTGAYNWKTDKFIPYDGSIWVTASKEALEYYIDPRNFLNQSEIFQFELLSYQKAYQTKAGVESILLNTPMYNTSYTYTDDQTKKKVTTTYGDTFIKAAENSLVSPYHLASRVKQEVVVNKTTLSSSVTGNVAGYKGYYNFFNIGATHSTVSGGAVANGLNYAKNGSGNKTTDKLYMIPWNSPYKSIVGGSNFIGSSYINRGQNTVYLQKFNATSSSTYTHQYMANVEAPKAEAAKTYAGYSAMEDIPIVFRIPVYNKMPKNACPQPKNKLNPNNWLKTLSVAGYNLTPTFKVEDLEGTVYNLIVPGKIAGVNISAKPVSSTAKVSGSGYVPLSYGDNKVTITVTAENKSTRKYSINIVRDNNTK